MGAQTASPLITPCFDPPELPSVSLTWLRQLTRENTAVDGKMDQHRMDRVGLLSPLEESSAEISRDSGIVSQSTSSLSMVSENLSSGTVSQSPSFGAAANVPQSPSLNQREEPGTTDPEFTEQDEEILRQTALGYSSYIRVTAGEEVCVRHRCMWS